MGIVKLTVVSVASSSRAISRLRRFKDNACPQRLSLLGGSRAEPILKHRAFFPAQLDLDRIAHSGDDESRRRARR
jgi:hypothetical protein